MLHPMEAPKQSSLLGSFALIGLAALLIGISIIWLLPLVDCPLCDVSIRTTYGGHTRKVGFTSNCSECAQRGKLTLWKRWRIDRVDDFAPGLEPSMQR